MSSNLVDPREELLLSQFEVLSEDEHELVEDKMKEFEMKKQQILAKQQRELEMLEQQFQQEIAVPTTPKKGPNSPNVNKTPSPIKSNPPSYFQQFSPKAVHEYKLKEKEREKLAKQNMSQSSFLSKLTALADVSQTERDIIQQRTYSFGIYKTVDLCCEEKEKYSGFKLSKRYVDREEMERLLADKKILRIDKLYGKISPPKFNEPDYPNWCLVGMVLEKSETKTSSQKSKYMKLTVGDYSNSVSVLLFGLAFKKYWKCRVGDVIMVLNPEIWTYHNGETKGFNLSIKEETLLEVGKVASFGYCKSMKKDNTRCTTPIDSSRYEHCSYHLDMAFKKSTNKRMELNGSIRLFSPTKNGKKQHVVMGGDLTSGYRSNMVREANEDTIIYGSKGKFLNETDKYQDPKILENLSQKRRKLNDVKKDKALEDKINSLLHKQKTLDKEDEKMVNTAFNSATLNKIGFNPTAFVSHNEKIERKHIINLNDIDTKNKKLGPSKETQMMKKLRYAAIVGTAGSKKEGGSKRETASSKKESLQESSKENIQKKNALNKYPATLQAAIDFGSSDESDLEIVGGDKDLYSQLRRR